LTARAPTDNFGVAITGSPHGYPANFDILRGKSSCQKP